MYSKIIILFLTFTFSLATPIDLTGKAKKDPEVIGGFVLYTYDEPTKKFEFFLVEKTKEPGDWSPPKGHAEEDEIPMDAAYREMREETTLLAEHYDVQFGLFEYFEYETNDDIPKHVSLWPARLTALDHPIVLSEESRDYQWADPDKCLSVVKKQYKQAYVNLLQKLYCQYGVNAC